MEKQEMEYAKVVTAEKTRHFISPDRENFYEFNRPPDQNEIRAWTEIYLTREGLERYERVHTSRAAIEANGAEIVTL